MKITAHCYALTGLSNIPPWTVNAGFVVGENQTLVIDTGANQLSAQTIFGYASNMRLQNSLIAVNTEQHLDHLNGNAYFRQQGVDVYGHYKIKRDEQDQISFVEDYNACITNPVRQQRREAEIFFANTHVVNPNKPLYTQTSFDLGGLEVQVVLTPGHTASNISIFVPTERVLFCGDCVVSAYLPNLEAGTRADWAIWLESLDKLTLLQPKIIVPGHGEVLMADKVTYEMQRTRQILQAAIVTGTAPTCSS